MRKGFTAFLLALSCFGVSAAVLADHTTKAASSLYVWDVDGDEVQTIYTLASGTRCNSTVLVSVTEATIQAARGNNDSRHGRDRSILLEGCAAGPVVISAGATHQCLVRPGNSLQLSVPCDEDEVDNKSTKAGKDGDSNHPRKWNHVRGTWQLIRI
ncbi:MAG: hypothetical protein M3R00_06755 [Pseudomonadota bacterium]|nr:hypothetical protein [Pseudomonadota bacterium]